ncbi:MAG: pyruvate formate lyase family protein, partial [Clostridia bacterium]|nr:pyruvate formate lyase family protein [Clostridia bacterium]
MISEKDRFYIERKYHDPEQPFDPFKRMAYHGIGYIEDSGLDDEALLDGLKSLPIEELPHPVAKGKAFAYLLQNERVYINEHDYFVGLYSLDRLAKCVTFSKWAEESLSLRDPELVQLSADVNACGAMMYWTDYDHVVPDWESLMKLGFPGIRERARAYREKHRAAGTLTEEADAFFEGIELQYTAILELLDRLIGIACQQSFEKAKEIAPCLEALRQGPPTTFYQALQLIYLYFITSECIDRYQVRSLGNGLDRTLYPFYKADLESGRYTEQELAHFLSYFLMQWSAIGNYWGQPFYLGGTNPDGSTKYNALSKLILDTYDALEIYNPKIQLKINENTPEWLLKKAFEMVRRKNASLVFCCEPGMMKAVMGYGATYEEALDFDIRGCYETGVRANEVCSTSGYINAAKAVEYVFTNGFDHSLNKQIGVATGDLSALTSFEDFYFAFLRQWAHLVDAAMKITNDAEKFLAFVNPSSLYSATIETALQNGKDGYGGGIKFSNNGMLCCSFASAVDSVLAVKEFVYDKKEITLSELDRVLKNNWEGSEILRAKVRRSPHKYGNN